MPATNRLIDLLALKMNCETFNLDCTDAYHQAFEKGADHGRCAARIPGCATQRRSSTRQIGVELNMDDIDAKGKGKPHTTKNTVTFNGKTWLWRAETCEQTLV